MVNSAITIHVTTAKALELLTELINTWPTTGQGYPEWHNAARNVLAAIYGDKSRELAAFANIRHRPSRWSSNTPGHVFEEHHTAGRKHAKAHLESLRDLLEKCSVPSSDSAEVSESIGDGSVFIVHGQNHDKLAEVKHLLGQLGIECCVLQDEPNAGQTIIEKFESHGGSSSYAIVLLTADDKGGSKQGDHIQDRARQNVIFEFGYFCGKLGRQRTVALYEPGVEIPSDLQGFVYVKLDSDGAWRYKLADELSSAGYGIDKNDVH